jgi:dienelactone hydrolase
MVRYAVNSDWLAACLYRPQLAGPQAGILVIAEDGTGGSQIQGVAERYAHVGYVTLLVDLHGSQLAASESSEAWTVAHLRAAVAWLRDRPFVQSERIGAVGFYAGGHYAIHLAGGPDPIQAAVSFYAPLAVAARAAQAARAPVLAFYGGQSAVPDGIARLRQALPIQSGHDVVLYLNIGDGFFNERSASFQFESAEDAWSRSNKFFYRHLGEPAENR